MSIPVFLQNYFQFLQKLKPLKPASSSIGLDIGTSTCKLVEITREENHYRLLHTAIEHFEGGKIREAIQRILAYKTTPVTNVYTSVFGKGTLIRYITMPRMSLEELKKSFSIESDKYFPFPKDQIYTDCCILNDNDKSKEMMVMVAAAKKELIDQRKTLLNDLGLDVQFIGMDAIVLANIVQALGTTLNPEPPVVAIFDVGGTVSNLTVFVNKIPRMTRDISLGGRDFTKQISQVLNCSLEEAERIKINPGSRATEISNACELVLKNMIQELKLSFDYFTTERNQEINCLFLAGGSSRLLGLKEALVRDLDVQISWWNPLVSVKVDDNSLKESSEKNISQLSVALGLALSNYD